MSIKTLFPNQRKSRVSPAPDTVNEAGGQAFSFSAEHSLAQYAVTGTFNGTFYATENEQLDKIKGFVEDCSPDFVAKVAVYAHRVGKMKDIPSFLVAWLAANGYNRILNYPVRLTDMYGVHHTNTVFNHVISNGKMLSNFVQIIRSGQLFRKSFGSATKRLIQNWILSKSPLELYLTSVGLGNPSMADIIKMVHPRPTSPEQNTIFGYLLDKEFNIGHLPEELHQFELLKKGLSDVVPNLPFRVLTNCKLSDAQWRTIAMNMPWNTLRMNLNSIGRHGVYNDSATITSIANKLRDRTEILRSKAMPYALLTAYQNTSDIPVELQVALQDALEIATENVPVLSGNTVVAIDVSGSMGSSITGYRNGAISMTRCVDVAALIASCILRQNTNAMVIQFDTSARIAKLNPRDSIVTNAKILACNGGGTDCSTPFRLLESINWVGENIILVSDDESWSGPWGGRGGTQAFWTSIHKRLPNCKLVNIDIQPFGTTQTPDKAGRVLNIGGFTDSVWPVISKFFGNTDVNFVDVIKTSVQ